MKKVLFIQELEFEFLGVMYISAVLKKLGCSTKLIFLNRISSIKEEIDKYKPDLVAALVMTGLHKNILKTFKKIKSVFPDIMTIAGGPHPTFFPEFIENFGVDVVCLGEGEKPIRELIENFDEIRKDNTNFEINNLWIKRKNSKILKCKSFNQYVSDLDEIEFPDREIYYEHKFLYNIPTRAIMAARGCPYKCGFCFNEKYTEIFGSHGYCRLRSPENIINEMKQIINKYPTKSFHFMDDTFIMNKKWLFEFLEQYKKEINIPFVCLGTANIINEEIVKKLKEANCHSIFFGIECGNEDYRLNILKKPVKNENIINAGEILKKYRLPFKAFNILGFPGETIENAWETVMLNIKVKTDYPWCALFAPYPGTRLAKYAKKLGELSEEYSPDDIPESFHKISILNSSNINQIQNLHKFFQTAVLFPFTIPIIKRLIKLKSNIFFNYWFGLIYFLVYYRAEKRSFFKTLLFGLKNLKFIIDSKRK